MDNDTAEIPILKGSRPWNNSFQIYIYNLKKNQRKYRSHAHSTWSLNLCLKKASYNSIPSWSNVALQKARWWHQVGWRIKWDGINFPAGNKDIDRLEANNNGELSSNIYEPDDLLNEEDVIKTRTTKVQNAKLSHWCITQDLWWKRQIQFCSSKE